MSEEAISVFLSYSRSDLEMLNRLNRQLASLVRTHKIKTWHDRDIEAGSEWEPEIQNHLNTADIIILLVSADFLDSEYCYGNELKRAIERHNAGEARVIPVILRPCLWNLPQIPFSKLNALPDHARPITKWEDPEEAFANVALQISNLVDGLRQRKVERETERQAEAARLEQQQAQAQLPLPETLRGDYAQLETLLKSGQWKAADEETALQMCLVMGRQDECWLRDEDIEQFPLADLEAIDQLWVMHSNGKFGFSVQKKIWQQYGSPTDYNKQFEKFGEAVGWRTKGFMGMGAEWKTYQGAYLAVGGLA